MSRTWSCRGGRRRLPSLVPGLCRVKVVIRSWSSPESHLLSAACSWYITEADLLLSSVLILFLIHCLVSCRSRSIPHSDWLASFQHQHVNLSYHRPDLAKLRSLIEWVFNLKHWIERWWLSTGTCDESTKYSIFLQNTKYMKTWRTQTLSHFHCHWPVLSSLWLKTKRYLFTFPETQS